MKITIKDLAREAGVSPASVSLVLNGRNCRIPVETQKRILDIANEKGYLLPKNRKVQKESRGIIGLIFQNFEHSVHMECIEGIEKQAALYGYNVISCNGGDTTEKTLKSIEILTDMNVSGLILIPPIDMNQNGHDVSLGTALAKSGLKFILLDRAINNVFCDFVTSDNKAGAIVATEQLLESGYETVGIISDVAGVYNTRKKMQGYREALDLQGIEFDEANVFNGDGSFESGFDAMKYFHSRNVEAVFSMNQEMAFGAYKYAKTNGLEIGKDVSIICFGYSDVCDRLEPSLNGIKEEGIQMGKKAMEILHGRITGADESPSKNNYFVPKLVEGNSIG